jgi:vitamin B12 transporter
MNLASRSAVIAALTLCTASLSATAQSPSHQIHGRVLDPLGELVPGATVELLHQQPSTDVLAHTSAGPEGTYTLSIPQARRYRIRVSAPTFRTTVTEPVYLSDGQALDLTLATPTLSEQITVTATGVPTPLAQTGESITILDQKSSFPVNFQIQQPLRRIPGVQIIQNGATGGATSLFLRGGNSTFTKVLVDGVPLNDVGGLVNFANISTVGIAQIEVMRQPNSALYGSDALSGVVALSTARGSTPLPQLDLAVDGGNLGQLHESAELAGAYRKFDYLSAFGRLDTQNDLPNNAFHNVSFAGNYGYQPDALTDLRFTFHHVVTADGQPSAIAFYGIPDAAKSAEQDTVLSATAQRQTTARLHNLIRYGREALAGQSTSFAPTGILVNGSYLGAPVTIAGANGYTVSGQAVFQYPGTYPSTSASTANRDFVYAQTDYLLTPHLTALGAFNYDAERGAAKSSYSTNSIDRRNESYTLQLAGDVRSRFFYVLGSGIERNDLYGTALTPRASLAYYAVRPNAQNFFGGTKLHASFGKGVKDASVYQQASSLYGAFSALPNGAALIAQYHTHPIGAEYSRSYEAGIEQQFGDGRAKLNATFFHNEFTNGIEYVYPSGLVQLGIPEAGDPNVQFGAYVNSQAYRAMGAELEAEFRITRRVFARTGYTYLDTVVQRSFSSDALAPSFNTAGNFGSIPIGAYSPLIGARPFRRAPHSGYFELSYAGARFTSVLSGTLVGRRDDSTFLSDQNFGNSLLLPNRNLDGAFQQLELQTDYRLTHRLTTYAQIDNLLNEKYQEALGYPALPITVRGGFRYSFGGESFRLR